MRDNKHVEYMSDAGLRALSIIARRVFETGTPIADVLRINGFGQSIGTVAARDAAFEAVRGRRRAARRPGRRIPARAAKRLHRQPMRCRRRFRRRFGRIAPNPPPDSAALRA